MKILTRVQHIQDLACPCLPLLLATPHGPYLSHNDPLGTALRVYGLVVQWANPELYGPGGRGG